MDFNSRFKRGFPGLPGGGGGGFQTGDLAPLRNLTLSISPVNEEVNRIVVKADVPHPGFGIRVTAIQFLENKAFIYVAPLRPAPGTMYPQVVATVQAATYVGKHYTPVFPPEYEKFMSNLM